MAEVVADYLEVESEEEENNVTEKAEEASISENNTLSVEEKHENEPISEQTVETEEKPAKEEEKTEQQQQSPIDGEVAVEEEVPVVKASIEADPQ